MTLKAPSSPSASIQFMVFVACFYGICSGMMNFINKIVLNSWSFKYPEVILAAQLIFTASGLKFMKICKKVELVSYDGRSARSCALVSLFFASNTCLALFALTGMNLPMYSALRRCTPLPSAVLTYFVFSKKPSPLVQLAVVLMMAGAVTGAFGDVNFEMTSYLTGCISIFLMASYLVTLQYTGVKDKMSSTDLIYVNSCNCIPFLLLLSLGSVHSISEFPELYNPLFHLSFLLVVASGAVLTYSMFLCTNVNSALTTCCVGVMKSAFVSVIGMFTFGGATPTPLLVIGLCVNFFGGAIYAFAKYRQSYQPPKESTFKPFQL